MTNHLRCVIVDDEQGAVDILDNYVGKVGWLDLAASFTDPLEALEYLSRNRVDLVLLDINMPDLSGMQLSRLIQANNMAVIFCTAYPQHAVESYEVQALDYLVKPVPFERFLAAVNKLRRSDTAINTETESSAAATGTQVFIKNGARIHQVDIQEISYLKKDGHYIVFQVAGRELLSRMTIAEALELLPEGEFIQVHRSYVVALKAIDLIQNHFLEIGGKEIPIGDSFRKQFFARIDTIGN